MVFLGIDSSTRAKVLWLFMLRQDVKALCLNIRRLQHRNMFSHRAIVGPAGPTVSMTSYGSRLETAFLAIESIGAGTLLPSRLILWLDERSIYEERPASIRRLEARGLEVRLTGSFGPHKKYYPYVSAEATFTGPLVTADDDALYAPWWLEGLAHAYHTNPRVLNCYRARVIEIGPNGIGPYDSWPLCRSDEAGFTHFPTGVSGCIHPPAFLDVLKNEGSAFLELCPKADDIWIHRTAIRHRFAIRQVFTHHMEFPSIPGTQRSE
jgi:hypothetical protein